MTTIRLDGTLPVPRRINGGTMGSYFEKIRFVFSDEWNGLYRKVVFTSVRGEEVSVIIGDDELENGVMIPWETKQYSGDATFVVSGYTIDDEKINVKIISKVGYIEVDATHKDECPISLPPTPDAYEQLRHHMQRDIGDSIRDALASGDYKGEPGDAATVEVGKTFSVPYGIEPIVSNSGTDSHAVLNFAIPAGKPGDKGEPGDSVRVGENGNWWIGDQDTGIPAHVAVDSIRYTPMSLTENQKYTSRKNIDATPVVLATASGERLTLSDADDGELETLNIYGKSTQIITTGAQLASFPDKSYVTANGITWSCKNGVITVKGTRSGAAKSNSSAVGIYAAIPIAAGTYKISGSVTEVEILVEITKANGSTAVWDESKGAFTLDGTEVSCAIYCNVNATTYVNVTVRPMVNTGTSAKPWEPYTGGAVSPSPNYPQAISSVGDDGLVTVSLNSRPELTISTPDGLCGVPVASGGNYTDENGQAWICDEIDFARGVRIRRIAKIQSYSGEAVGEHYLSTTGVLTNGASVIYALDVPVETALSNVEIDAFKSLRTTKPATVITNDSGAGMAVEYAADTKGYVDTKYLELANAILELEDKIESGGGGTTYPSGDEVEY